MNAKQTLSVALAALLVTAGAGVAAAGSVEAPNTDDNADEHTAVPADAPRGNQSDAANGTDVGPDANASETAHRVYGVVQQWLSGETDGKLGPAVADAASAGNSSDAAADAPEAAAPQGQVGAGERAAANDPVDADESDRAAEPGVAHADERSAV